MLFGPALLGLMLHVLDMYWIRIRTGYQQFNILTACRSILTLVTAKHKQSSQIEVAAGQM
jgi:hypothetical protein